MAAEGNIITFIFTGPEDGVFIPRNVTHLIIHESITVIPALICLGHPNIVEVYCHAGVLRIERFAFPNCPRLRRVIIPGIEVVGDGAFCQCYALMYIECPKLERIGRFAFCECRSLVGISLPSVKIVEFSAFGDCAAMTKAKFGKNLESIDRRSFRNCRSLEQITVPLKNGLITDDDIFQGCGNLRRVDLVEEAMLHDTVAALQLEDWRNDMTEEIDSINHILPDAHADKSILIMMWGERQLQYESGSHVFSAKLFTTKHNTISY